MTNNCFQFSEAVGWKQIKSEISLPANPLCVQIRTLLRELRRNAPAVVVAVAIADGCSANLRPACGSDGRQNHTGGSNPHDPAAPYSYPAGPRRTSWDGPAARVQSSQTLQPCTADCVCSYRSPRRTVPKGSCRGCVGFSRAPEFGFNHEHSECFGKVFSSRKQILMFGNFSHL